MKLKTGFSKSWLHSTFITITVLLMLFQPLAPAIPLATSSNAAAQAEEPQALSLNSLFLAGVDGYVGVPYSTALNTMSAITIEAWVYREHTSRSETVVGNGWMDSYWLGFSDTGKLRFIPHGGGSSVDGNATITAGEWTHVAATYNGLTRNYYINGVLDITSNLNSGAITPNPIMSTELGIGYDSDPGGDNYFDGMIDEVRIWNVVRTPAQIQASMFQTLVAPYPSTLVGYWRLNGNALDQTGHHNGAERNFGMDDYYVNNGGLPKDIRIPQVSNTPSLDGVCGATEYANAITVSVDGVPVTLQHTDTDLWACFDFGTDSSYAGTRLLLDPTHDRLDPAQTDDIRLEVHNDNTLAAYAGNDAGSWVITTTYDTRWHGEYSVGGGEFPTYSAEFRVGSSVVGGWGHVVGLALKPYRSLFVTDIWPALAVTNLPSTWSSATLADTGPWRYFNGSVVYQPKDLSVSPTGVEGAKIDLYGYDLGGSESQVATASSVNSGSFNISTNDDFTYHRLELTYLPQGYTSVSAQASSPGTVIDSRTIDYGNAVGGTYSNIKFTLGDTVPYNVNAAYGPVFLIITSQAVINSDALDAFVMFKSQQGYAVHVRSVEDADTGYPGTTRVERIRAMEQDYLADYGSRFQFVMLVGTHAVIPFAKVTAYATGDSPVCPTEDPPNYKYSEWLYVDLTSDPNSNGNDCALDGPLSDPTKRLPGYIPDSFAFDPTVALGRIPFDQPDTIRQVLQNSIGFEKQTESYKLKALNGMSMVALKGYFNGVACTWDNWGNHCVAPLPNDQSNYDTSLLSEEMKNDFLDANGFNTTRLYENEAAVAGGQGILSPVDLTRDAMRTALDSGRFGVATMSGHGNGSGVYRNFWSSDKNGNGVVDVTDDNSTNELSETTFFDISGVLDQIDPDGSRGSVFVLSACSNATPTNPSNLAATILSDGHGVASVAALSVVTVGSWFNESHGNDESIAYYVNQRLVSSSYRLGESVWWTLADLVYKKLSGSGGVAFDLYGDPTLSFYGNPGGQTTLAAWPMGRRDPTGASYLTLPGPTYPNKLWEFGTQYHEADTYGPTPLVSANGEVIVANGMQVDVLRQGVLFQRLNLDAIVFGSPALSADGTIYVMDQEADLYAFPYKRLTLNNHTILLDDRQRRWKVDLGEFPYASPIVGSDGFILAGVGKPLPRLWSVRPDGTKFTSFALDWNPTSYAATDASRTVYVATWGDQGHLYRFTRFCDTSITPDVCPYSTWIEATSSAPFNTSPLLAYGSVYIGDMDHILYKYNKDTLAVEATFTTDGYIQAGPIISSNGDILFVTDRGTMYSLTKDLNTVRWQKDLGYSFAFTANIPAASNNAIYLVFDGYLHAYNPSSGAQLWKRSLGGETGLASVAVGYGREVYVQTSGVLGKVFAFGEGWGLSAARITATVMVNGPRQLMSVEILQSLTPISNTLSLTPEASFARSSSPMGEGEEVMAPAATIVGILLQRSADGGPWVDLAILPPGTNSYTDPNIQAGVSYAYRAQNLMSDGSNSDFVTTPEVTQSYPALPGAPTLDPVQVDGAEALGLSWTPAANSVVDHYIIERGPSGSGPFTAVITVTGETTSLQDTGLTPATPYYYRVRASNSTGTSAPSNVQSGTTRSQTLPAPQNFKSELKNQKEIRLTWDAGPSGATAVLEMIAFGEVGYSPLTSVPATDGAFTLFIGEPGAYNFRIKYVLGNNESPYASSTTSLVIYQTQLVYLPVFRR